MSLVHVETDFGTKMAVHQGSCNLDRSCVRGECPSFVIARHGSGRAGHPPRTYPTPPAALPDPPDRRWSGTTVIRMPGIGGTGVVTASRIIAMSAHLAGLQAASIDQTGLAQKGGPVTSDVRISSAPITGDVHASPGGADLLLGFDLLGAAGDEALAVASPEHTVAVLNVGQVPTASMLRHQDATYPLAAGLRARVARSTRSGDMVCVDAHAIAEHLTGDHLAANLVLVGSAFQAGLLPFGARELDEAVRLNGVDVPASLAAIAWGRAAVARPDAVADALAGSEGAPRRVSERELPADLEPDAAWPAPLRQVVRLRVAELIDFQSARVARAYLARVREVAERERTATLDPAWPVTETFARGLYALVAIKDEYEVARLHLLDEEQEAFSTRLPRARAVPTSSSPPCWPASAFDARSPSSAPPDRHSACCGRPGDCAARPSTSSDGRRSGAPSGSSSPTTWRGWRSRWTTSPRPRPMPSGPWSGWAPRCTATPTSAGTASPGCAPRRRN